MSQPVQLRNIIFAFKFHFLTHLLQVKSSAVIHFFLNCVLFKLIRT